MNRDSQLIYEAYEAGFTGVKTNADGTKMWYVNGQFHREDGPAIEWPNGRKAWYVNNKLHRIDGPAIEWSDSNKQWFVNGKRHREDGPAIESAGGTKEWYVNNKLHRLDGPAIEYSDGVKEWYINGKRFHTPEEWAEAVLKKYNKPSDPRSVDNFLRPILAKYMDELF